MELTRQQRHSITLGHVAPFALWIAVMLSLQLLERSGGCPRWLYPWSYAAKSVVCVALLLVWRPWRVYPRFAPRHLWLAVAAGLAVAVLWVLPETPWVADCCPRLLDFYYRWLVMLPGGHPDYYQPALFPALPPGHLSLAYSVEEAGWGLAIMKLLGSAITIAVAEEFFFRGFLYRWLRQGEFWKIPLDRFDAQAFWMVVAVFGLEHDRWLAGMAAGAVYGWLAVRTGNVWAGAIAHGITNFALGVYVMVSRQYGFW